MEEFEESHILKKLPKLIKFTNCNVDLIAQLSDTFSKNELDTLKSKPTPQDKAEYLYSVAIQKHDGYKTLISAFKASKQSGALKILLEGTRTNIITPVPMFKIPEKDEPKYSGRSWGNTFSRDADCNAGGKDPFYNAVILDEKEAILGRIHFTDRASICLPSEWVVRYRESKLVDDEYLKEKILSGPNNLLVIAKLNRKFVEIPISIRTLTGKACIILVKPEIKIEGVKEIVYDIQGIPTDHQRLISAGRQLEDGRTLFEYKIPSVYTGDIEDEADINLVLRLRGGGFHDLEGTRATERGDILDPFRNEDDIWTAFSRGFNIIGNCENSQCTSHRRRPVVLPIITSHVIRT